MAGHDVLMVSGTDEHGTPILRAAHLNRLSYTDRATGQVVRRYEHPYPGSLVHVDVKKIRNIPEDQMDVVLNIVCPNTVYPYLRANIADVIQRSGFPPIHQWHKLAKKHRRVDAKTPR